MLKDKKNKTRQIQINAQKKTEEIEMLNKQSEEDLAIHKLSEEDLAIITGGLDCGDDTLLNGGEFVE